MKNFNYHPYQAYQHPPYRSTPPQPPQLQQQQQQQPSQRPQHLRLPPPPPLQQRPTHLHPHYLTQQQLPTATATASTAYAAQNVCINSTTAVPTALSSDSVAAAPMTSANLLQNQYNLNYAHGSGSNNHSAYLNNHNVVNSNNNNNNNNNNLIQQQLHQHQHQQQHQLQQLEHAQSMQQQSPLQFQQQQRHTAVEALVATPLNTSSFSSTPHAAAGSGDKFTMDACEIANFLANELFMQQLVSMDGIQSGVPTLTTSTLTPTTLRSIEETFIQLTSEPHNVPYQAGFIPPPLASFNSAASSSATPTPFQEYNDANETESEDSQGSYSMNDHLNEDNSLATTDNSSAATDTTSFQNGLNGIATSSTTSTNDFTSAIAAAAAAKNAGLLIGSPNTSSNSATAATPAPTRRNQGGRRPAKATNMSPEEEEKRRIRRERNKLAAARCRKRRVDQTNELLEVVAQLERKREDLQHEIENLSCTKQELEYVLESHRPTCQKIRNDMLSVNTFGGLITPATNSSTSTNISINENSNGTITGLDTTLASTGRSGSPIDLKPVILHDSVLDMVQHIKNEPLDSALDSNSSLEHEGPPSPKRLLLSNNNPTMIPPTLPNVSTLSASLAAASASLNTPVMPTAPVSFGSFSSNNATLNTLNALHKPQPVNKQRPNTLPNVPRNLAQNLALSVDGKPPTDINGVAIQTPSTGMFNFDSLMDGGTGLTPVSGPLVPTCSSQNKHPLELPTPTSEPSKLVSL